MKYYIENLLKLAIDNNSSDIYILPNSSFYIIKMRSKTAISTYEKIKISKAVQLINYCKYHSNMIISESRRPQLGSITFKLNNLKYYLRLSTVGNFKGQESLVIRIIYSINNSLQLFFDNNQFMQLLKSSHKRGLILLAGPTGSGKTTTIYHLAKQHSDNKMIMTIEDPVEIIEDEFLQLQINEKAGMSYQELLKVGLRHRPDIFIIGEIRDSYTAKMAVQAALSGHLVLSTIHAKSAIGIIDRLLQLGVNKDYLIQSLNLVAYQRLLPNNHNSLQALLDIKEQKDIFNDNSNVEFNDKWRHNLNELYRKNKITFKTYEQFKLG